MTDTGSTQPNPPAGRAAEERITELEAFAFRAGSDLADIRATVGQLLDMLQSYEGRFDRLDTEIGLTRDEVRKNTASLEDIRGRTAEQERR